MAQGDLPEIFGSDWEPKETLEFIQPLLQSAAKREVMLFVAQKHDGRIALISDVWDHIISNEPKQFEGPSWHKFCTVLFMPLVKQSMQQIMTRWPMKRKLK